MVWTAMCIRWRWVFVLSASGQWSSPYTSRCQETFFCIMLVAVWIQSANVRFFFIYDHFGNDRVGAETFPDWLVPNCPPSKLMHGYQPLRPHPRLWAALGLWRSALWHVWATNVPWPVTAEETGQHCVQSTGAYDCFVFTERLLTGIILHIAVSWQCMVLQYYNQMMATLTPDVWACGTAWGLGTGLDMVHNTLSP